MDSQFYIQNRSELMKQLKGGLAILSAHTLLQKANDSAYVFHQEANFRYLSGIVQADWLLILDGHARKSWLVAPNIDEVHRVFEGGLSAEAAQAISGVDKVIEYNEAEALLRRLSQQHSIVYTLGEHPHAEYFNFTENPAQKKLWLQLDRIFNSVQDCRLELAKMRAIKRPEEIAAMKKAIKYTTQAFDIVKEQLPLLKHEYEVEAEFTYHFKKQGLNHAYEPIVADGKNACTLHYGENKDRLKKNTILLMDIGAEYEGYAADITRSYAVGTVTARQAAVHEAVVKAHETIVALLKPGLAVEEYYRQVDSIMKQALIGLRLMKRDDDEENYRRYFPHAISHGLGIDVHDSLGRAHVFQPGMVLTVEPGIYIPEEGIGVRIEDDILLTQKGHENLSRHLSTDL